MSEESEKVTCPDCDEEFTHLGIHWARSKECDYPILALSEEAVLDGLMFAGGSLLSSRFPACTPLLGVPSWS